MSIIITPSPEEVKVAISSAVDRAHSLGYADGKDDGYKQGFTEGATSNDEEVFNEGYNQGYADGYEEGKLDGDYDEGFEDGRNSMIDEDKIIEKTATGTGVVALDDVSELPHDITVQLIGENVGGKEVKVYGKNLFDNDTSKIKEVSYLNSSGTTENKRQGYEIYLPNGTYVVRTLLKEGEQEGNYIYGVVVDADNKVVQSVTTFVETNSNGNTKPVVFEIKDGYVLKIYNGNAGTGNAATKTIFQKYNIQVESEIQTPFEPYISPITYTADADGKVTINSLSPSMSIICEGTDISVSYRADWGIIKEREKQWNSMTQNGTRRTYTSAFSFGFGDGGFCPHIDLKVSNGSQMFQSSRVANLTGCFKKYGTRLNTEEATTLYYAFSSAFTQYIPEISLEGITSGTTGTSYTFNSSNIRKIEKLIFKEDGTTPIASTMFTGATGLTEIRIGGVIGQSISFSACPLSRASIDNVFDHLKAFGTVWTKNEEASKGYYTWNQDRETGTYPFDKIKVVLNEGLNPAEYKVLYEVGEDSGYAGNIDAYFDEKGVCELLPNAADDKTGYLTLYGVVKEGEGDVSDYTVYEGIIHETPATPPSVTLKQSAIDTAYTEEEWNAKVEEVEGKGWTIKTV